MLCLFDHLIEFPQLKPMITSLVHSLHNGTIKLTSDLINHVPYHAVVDAVGGTAAFLNIALNAVDPRVLALQGQTITVEKLYTIKTLDLSVLDLFGLRPGGNCSNVGLNIVPPLAQVIELAPTVRGDFAKRLEASDDPEIREWPKIRAKQQHGEESTSKKRLVSENMRLTPEQNIQALCDAVQKDKMLSESNYCSIPCHGDGDEASVPFGLKRTGFTESNSLIWASNLQRYRVILDTLQVGPQRPNTGMFSAWTQNLIESSNLRLILLCGSFKEDIALTTNDQQHSLTLNLQGIDFKIWLRLGLSGDTIERIFVRSHAPLVRMWASKGMAAQKLGALFRFVNSIIGLKLFAAFYQSALTLLLIIRGWDDERSGNAQPLSPEMEKLDPTLRIWLSRLGFTKDGDILLGRTGGSGGQRVPRPSQKNRGAIPRETMQGVRSLLKGVQEAQFHCGENISQTILPETKMQEEAQEAKFSSEELSSHEAPLKSDKPDSDDFNEELVSEDLLDDAISNGSIMVEPYVPEQPAEILRRRTEFNKLSWRRSLELMTGYQFKGHETKKGRVSSYSFGIYYVLFYIHEAPPDCKLFFVKAELAPPGKHHPNAYATRADEIDPGARFALRIAIHDDNGEETFFQFSTSHTWKGIAIANAFVDTFSGDSLQVISQRKRRYLYVHKRIKDVSVELQPLISGAYRNESGEVVKRSKDIQRDTG
ncbi:uncharacterized protein N7483_008854 [Penicillium malachiteum]|uniref:uncharacterized protein n=1 Tax=Penicillium malachiteum TaxID=1324776 RepID=UPI0025490966|nr:uncharacterized protein N7483_008854 [Penicillium malachiteum]KAJ5720920.1 hypothetical protein N7483_008854 [Penicillium malachiteum]